MGTFKNTTINDTGHLTLPSGTTAQRPASPANGMIRYNSTSGTVELYTNGNWATVGLSSVGGSSDNPATSAAAIRTALGASAANGDYWYKPSGYTGSAIQCYTNFTNAPSGKGYVMVARGRESTDWWNTAGQNTSGLALANINTNTPIAVAPSTFVNGLAGGNWNVMKMLTNRINIGDSLYIEGVTNASFSWPVFNQLPSSLAATITRYGSAWKAGGASYTGTNTGYFTDTLSGGFTGNDCSRLFTWTWGEHGGYQGWSAGVGCAPSGSFQYASETHAINLVNVYIEC
jgi:hypothetical protein